MFISSRFPARRPHRSRRRSCSRRSALPGT
jgi:hypothetical protein